jgi:hypothetical protein
MKLCLLPTSYWFLALPTFKTEGGRDIFLQNIGYIQNDTILHSHRRESLKSNKTVVTLSPLVGPLMDNCSTQCKEAYSLEYTGRSRTVVS